MCSANNCDHYFFALTLSMFILFVLHSCKNRLISDFVDMFLQKYVRIESQLLELLKIVRTLRHSLINMFFHLLHAYRLYEMFLSGLESFFFHPVS